VRAGTDKQFYDKEQEEARRKVGEIKQLLAKFKAGLAVREGSSDYH